MNPVPFVTGAPSMVQLLTKDLPGITGGVFHVEQEAKEAANAILAIS